MYFPDRLRTPPDVGRPVRARGSRARHRRRREGDRLVSCRRRRAAVGALLPRQRRLAGYRVNRFRAFAADGTGLAALSYRGYGGSTGSPTEAGLIADAEAAYAFAAARHAAGADRGLGRVAWHRRRRCGRGAHRVGRVVLESPFTSAADVGARVYWYLPVRRLMKDPFRSDQRIAKVTRAASGPAWRARRVVPIDLGEKLFALANEPEAVRALSRGDPRRPRRAWRAGRVPGVPRQAAGRS